MIFHDLWWILCYKMHGITVNVDHKVKGHDVWCWWVTTKNNMCFNQFQIYDNIAEKGCAGGLNMVGFFTTLKRWPESNIIYGSTVRTCNAIKNFNSTFCILDPPSFDQGGSKVKGQFLSYMVWQLWHPICHCSFLTPPPGTCRMEIWFSGKEHVELS